MKPVCSIEGCERERYCRGWCTAHYNRWWATGDTGDAKTRQSIGTDLCGRCRARPKLGQGYCKECKTEATREDRRRNGRAHKSYWLKQVYGITIEFYEALWTSQAGLCAICERPERVRMNGRLKRLAVDHDAVSGEIRGLLCFDCNTSIGKFHHSDRVLRNAAAYLEASSWPTNG